MAPNVARLTSTVVLFSAIASSGFAAQVSNTTITSSLNNAVGTTTAAAASASGNTTASASGNTTAAVALDPTVTDCFITLPDNALTAEGLATPFLLMPPCSMAVGTQQAFAEAAVFDPTTGEISIYHPLVLDAGKTASVPPVVPTLPAGASVALWFGFNGDTLQLLDTAGKDANTSPSLSAMKCVNGEPGISGDIFGQVSWCNTVAFFTPVTASVASGKTTIPPLGTDHNGQDCPSSRSFTVVDQDPSDNLPTQYLLLPDGSTIQDTAINRANNPDATVINNASDEALIGDIIDPLIGCTPFKVNSLDDPGTLTSSLATQELQAGYFQKTPLALVELGDPDCLLTASGDVSTSKTNNYRIGVNQPLLGAANSDNGSSLAFCNNMITYAPPWFVANQAVFSAQATPDPAVGNNLFTFLCNRYLQSFVNIGCTPTLAQTVTCQLDGNGVATSCTISSAAGAGANSTSSASLSVGGSTSLSATTMVTSTLSSVSTASGVGSSSVLTSSAIGGIGGSASSVSTSSTVGGFGGSASSSVVLTSSSTSSPIAASSSNGTVTLSSVSRSVSALPTLTSSSIISSNSLTALSTSSSAFSLSSATGTASLNSATVTAKATSAPVASAHPHQTFSYEFPRHRMQHFGGGFNPATIAHATGTTAFVPGTSSGVALASQSTPSAANAIQSVPAAATSTGVAATQQAGTSSLLQAYQPTSFVTIIMTVTQGGSTNCAPTAS